MKVRGKVRLMCEFCKKVVVRLSRKQHYVYIYCTKNPRHKQRTKFLAMSTQSEAHCCDGHHAGWHADTPTGLPCLPEPKYSLVQQHMLGSASRSLLGNRHTSVLGELYWRAALAGRDM
ncbi:mitochondrial ribosomal protein L36 [Volvox carteri f. nagariensis]|uniref:Ribosomal protein n=1 Tax=Volvox carteri f. nagariensis TaxID=3068 RepID=D8U823_VOLCA|nr:mitochondrial ribosomal protein L36 [Volvox carteri f. nagariensis]EFJ44192.1 mitochondrial ribosomal protein L36 [Volvox carteri f. nagariensis]|eukprot:XP_002954786.1 mitochondrial ribosomal protein L36 [Volvox carteri f. nagariensis]